MEIGFGGNPGNVIKGPENFSLCNCQQIVNPENYLIDFNVTSDWGQAFNGEIHITNLSNRAIEDWEIEFDFDRTIEQFWTAQLLNHSGQHYIVKNAQYNATINPGQTLTLGFSGTPGDVKNKPTNYILKEYTICDNTNPEVPELKLIQVRIVEVNDEDFSFSLQPEIVGLTLNDISLISPEGINQTIYSIVSSDGGLSYNFFFGSAIHYRFSGRDYFKHGFST